MAIRILSCGWVRSNEFPPIFTTVNKIRLTPERASELQKNCVMFQPSLKNLNHAAIKSVFFFKFVLFKPLFWFCYLFIYWIERKKKFSKHNQTLHLCFHYLKIKSQNSQYQQQKLTLHYVICPNLRNIWFVYVFNRILQKIFFPSDYVPNPLD